MQSRAILTIDDIEDRITFINWLRRVLDEGNDFVFEKDVLTMYLEHIKEKYIMDETPEEIDKSEWLKKLNDILKAIEVT